MTANSFVGHDDTSVQVMLTQTERSSRFDGGKTTESGPADGTGDQPNAGFVGVRPLPPLPGLN